MGIDTSAIVAKLMMRRRPTGWSPRSRPSDPGSSRGRHPAARDEPLLFVGDDFAKTDVAVAEW